MFGHWEQAIRHSFDSFFNPCAPPLIRVLFLFWYTIKYEHWIEPNKRDIKKSLSFDVYAIYIKWNILYGDMLCWTQY